MLTYGNEVKFGCPVILYLIIPFRQGFSLNLELDWQQTLIILSLPPTFLELTSASNFLI